MPSCWCKDWQVAALSVLGSQLHVFSALHIHSNARFPYVRRHYSSLHHLGQWLWAKWLSTPFLFARIIPGPLPDHPTYCCHINLPEAQLGMVPLFSAELGAPDGGCFLDLSILMLDSLPLSFTAFSPDSPLFSCTPQANQITLPCLCSSLFFSFNLEFPSWKHCLTVSYPI